MITYYTLDRISKASNFPNDPYQTLSVTIKLVLRSVNPLTAAPIQYPDASSAHKTTPAP